MPMVTTRARTAKTAVWPTTVPTGWPNRVSNGAIVFQVIER